MARFQKGQSGNPAGKARGTKSLRTKLMGQLEKDAPKLIERAKELATAGDSSVMVALLNRLIPALRPTDRAAVFQLDTAQPAEVQGRQIITATTRGEITADQAAALMALVEKQVAIEQHGSLLTAIARLMSERGMDMPADLRLRLENMGAASGQKH